MRGSTILDRFAPGELRQRYKQITSTSPGRIVFWAAIAMVAWLLSGTLLPDGAPVGIILQGVLFGTITALLAIGLILTYRTDRIINFAYAAMGGVGGVLSVHLFLEWHWNYFLSLGLGVVTGIIVGGLTEVLVIRRFRNSSRLVLTVATIGLAQVFGGIQLMIPQWFGSSQGGLIGGLETPLSDFNRTVHPVLINGDHFLIVAAVPPIILALAWFLLRTDAGVAVRAAAENRDRAMLLGIPIQRLATLVWIIAGGLASLTFALKAPFAGAVSTALGGTTLLLPALAAAVLARMESLPRAFAAGVALGIVEQVTFWNTGQASTIDVAFLVVILIGLLVQREVLSRAEDAGESSWSMADAVRRVPIELRHLPEVRAVRIGAGLLLLTLAIFLPQGWSVGSVILASSALIWAMVAISLVILTGWGGNISLGQFAIAGVGAITAGNLVARYNLDLFVVLALAGVAGGVAALAIGVPALRIRGLFLAVTTLAFAVALDSYFLNPNTLPGIVKTDVPRQILFQRWDLNNHTTYYYLCLFFFVASLLVANKVRQTRSGRVLLATKDNLRAAAAASVPTTSVRLTGFVFSGIIAGIGGGLFTGLIFGAGAGDFKPQLSLEVFSFATIGGLGSLGGAVSGVFFFRWLGQYVSGEARLIVNGVGLLLVLMVLPGGLAQIFLNLRDKGLRRLAQWRGIHVPSLFEDKRLVSEEEALEAEAPDETNVIAGALSEIPTEGEPDGDGDEAGGKGDEPDGNGPAPPRRRRARAVR